MEDTHVCISDLAEKFGYQSVAGEAVSFYGVTSWRPVPLLCFYDAYLELDTRRIEYMNLIYLSFISSCDFGF